MPHLMDVQRFISSAVRQRLKPWYRTLFPNRLYVAFFPTCRCNYHCSYCTVAGRTNLSERFGPEHSVAEWIEAFERLPAAVVSISGGEPLLFKDFPELLNRFPVKHVLLGAVTNLSAPLSLYEQIERPYLRFVVGLHREHTTEQELIEKAWLLSARFRVEVNLVATPENLPHVGRIQRLCRERGIPLHVEPMIAPGFRYSDERMAQVHLSYDRKILPAGDYGITRCSAGRNYINIAPDGQVFTCYSGLNYCCSPLYASAVDGRPTSQFRLGNLFDGTFQMNPGDLLCPLPCGQSCDRDVAIIRPLPARANSEYSKTCRQ